MFSIYRHHSINPKSLASKLHRASEALARGDFAGAKVSKLRNVSGLYRAALDDKARLVFKFGNYDGKLAILLLELLPNHEYEKSRFLRGYGVTDESFESVESSGLPSVVPAESETIKYLNPKSQVFHYLDRVLSFDADQEQVLSTPTPLVIIGSAGSGKTVLTLEKIKSLTGSILFVTHSAHLADSARRLYHAQGFEDENQEVTFFSFKEVLESLSIPGGKEAHYKRFVGLFDRVKANFKLKDAHKVFEEIRGVLTGFSASQPYLSREQYLRLGVKQSIFLESERENLYSFFERYLELLKKENLFDPNILAYEYRSLATKTYDYAVIDEVQDFTMTQIELIRSCLKNPMHFVMSGDANQIVHPNFFSWAKVRSYLYEGHTSYEREAIHVLKANYRSASKVTEVANKILVLKNLRFGSVDKESTILVEPMQKREGDVRLVKSDPASIKDLNTRTCRSTKCCVVVLRDEDKALAAKFFDTPLIFSVHEAKGLEYESVILFDIVEGASKEYQAIVGDLKPEDLGSEVNFNRAKDKSDKSAEIYKFYINSLYVAITRAVERVYVIERGKTHDIYRLLGLSHQETAIDLKTQESSIEDWQKEARKLELQGKTDQADQIRRDILKAIPVPWKILTDKTWPEWAKETVDTNHPNKKSQHVVFEFANLHGLHHMYGKLGAARYAYVKDLESSSKYVWNKHYLEAAKPGSQHFWAEVKKYGIEHRSPINETPLMRAVRAGSVENVKKLLDLGADINAVDTFGCTAYQKGLRDVIFPTTPVKDLRENHAEILPLVQPESRRVKLHNKLIKLDASTVEFFLFNLLTASYPLLLTVAFTQDKALAVTARLLEQVFGHFHGRVLPDHRKRRVYINGMLAKSEVFANTPHSRRLLLRIQKGQYIINPLIEIEIDDQWVPYVDCFGGRLMASFVNDGILRFLAHYQQESRESIVQHLESLMVAQKTPHLK